MKLILKIIITVIKHSIIRHRRLWVPCIFIGESQFCNVRVVFINCNVCGTTISTGYYVKDFNGGGVDGDACKAAAQGDYANCRCVVVEGAKDDGRK